MEALAQRFRGDRALVLLPMQHLFGPSPMQQILVACLAPSLRRDLPRRLHLGGSTSFWLRVRFGCHETVRATARGSTFRQATRPGWAHGLK